MKYNLNLWAPFTIFIGVILLINKKKNDVFQTYLGYASLIFGISWFAYSSKALLLLMYQKFIQEEVNIQIQQQGKQNQKNQSKKKQYNKSENYAKTSEQQKQQQIQQTTQEMETQQQLKEEKSQMEIKKQQQKQENQEKENKLKQEQTQKQQVKKPNNSQVQQVVQVQNKKENKQQKIKQIIVQQENNDDDDEEWVEVGNKKKQQNRQQKNEEEVLQQPQQNQKNQKNQVIEQQQQLQSQTQVQTTKQDPKKQELTEVSKQKNQKEKKQKLSTKQKIEENVQIDNDDNEDEWISVEIKYQKNKDKNNLKDDEQKTNNNQQKSKGLFTKEEYMKLKDEAKQIEEAYKQRIQQIDDIHHFKQISKLTQYEIKNVDQILNNQNATTVPKVDLKVLNVQPKTYTREEIDKLVQDKMPKPKNIISNDVFIDKSEPIKQQTKKNVQDEKSIIKSKFTLLKPLQQEQQKQIDQTIYTDPTISFIVNKDTSKAFFSDQIELTTNTTGKELFGRVKRYRRPIQQKNKSEAKQNKNEVENSQFVPEGNDNFEPTELEQGKVILPGYQTLDEEARQKLIRETVPVLYRQDQENENILEEETMSLLLAGSKEIIHEDYIQLLNKFRQLRRKTLEEQKYDQYITLIEQMDEEIYQKSQNGIHTITQCLDIREEDYQKTFLFYSQQQEFFSQLAYFQQNLKDIPSAKFKLNKQQGLELIKYKIYVIENYKNNEQFSSVMRSFENQQLDNKQEVLPILLNSLIDDIIYQKFGYEEEDKIRFMKLFDKDQEVRELQLKLDHLVENLYGVQQVEY